MMRGTIDFIYPNQPGEFRMLNRKPPSIPEIEALIGGTPYIVPQWNQWVNWAGLLVPATVVANEDWRSPIQPLNFIATAVWHYTAKQKGVTLTSQITGPVAVFTGDDEFMESLLQN